MAVADTLITRYQLDDRYSQKAKQVEQATRKIGDAMDGAGKRAGGLSNILATVGRGAVGALSMLGQVAGVGAIGILGLAGVAVKASADMDSLKRALVAVAGSSEEAEKQLARLKEVAKAPGLGFKEAIQGSVRLQAAGFSALLAERALKAFGNAIATVGGGKEELDGVSMALAQIASKGKISAEEILQLAERVPQIRKAMQAAFGTSDTEKLQEMGIEAEEFVSRVVSELEKLPQVTGGAKNAIENLGDALFRAFSQAGDVINRFLIPAIETVGSWLTWMVETGVITRIVEGFLSLFNLGSSDTPIVKLLAYLTATFEELPSLVRRGLNYIGEAFEKVGRYIKLTLAAAFAILVTGAVFRAITAIITAYRALGTTLAGIAAIQAFMVGLVPGGIAQIAIATALGVAAFGGMMYLLNKVGEEFNNLKPPPIWTDIATRSAILEEQFKNQAGNTPVGMPGASEAGSSLPDRKPATALQAIARATGETARNTREQVDLQRFALGGGDLGKLGVDAVQIRRMKRGAIDVNVSGADESINRILSELLRAILPIAVKQSRGY